VWPRWACVYHGAVPVHYQPLGARMIQFFLTLQRLVRGIAAAWKRDPQFRSLAVLVVFTLLSGTLFYRAVEGWSTVDAFYFSVITLTTVGSKGQVRARLRPESSWLETLCPRTGAKNRSISARSSSDHATAFGRARALVPPGALG
jgi:hypothetical protein